MTTISTSGAVYVKAGENARVLTDAQTNEIIEQAENFVSASSRYDWISNWASLSGTAGAKIVKEAVEDWAAMGIVSNDMSGYTSRLEAQTILDVLWSKIVECVNLLRDEKFRTFTQTGST